MRAPSTFGLVLVASVLTLALAGVVRPGAPWYSEAVLALAFAIAGAITLGARFVFRNLHRRRHGTEEENDDEEDGRAAREALDDDAQRVELDALEGQDEARGARAGDDGGSPAHARRRNQRARSNATVRLSGDDVAHDETLFETRVRRALEIAREEIKRAGLDP
jgi:hypothetical protein